MRREIFLLVLVLGLVAAAHPAGLQADFRAWGGLTSGRYQGLPPPVGIPELRYQNAWRTGFGLGAGLELRVPRAPLSLILGLGYLQKGSELEIYYLDTKTGSYLYRLGTLSQTGLVKIGLDTKIAPYLLAGYELAFILSNRGQPFGPPPGGWDTDLKPDTRKLDPGLVAGVGLEFKLEKISPFIEICYFHGLSNLSLGKGTLEYYETIKSRALILSAGLKFGRKKT
ncbi:MAG: PorT family protein [Candidatus Saccharicenans sp.]|nr:PorT family protein [Candidatus Saccharicenans sp.]MDH7492351.1 outer membrane beta-barrel protein [Candidatus Saccharicenans sp.]